MYGIDKIVVESNCLAFGGEKACRELLDVVSSGIFLIDKDRKIKFVNKYVLLMFDRSLDWFLGMDFLTLMSGIGDLDDIFNEVKFSGKMSKMTDLEYDVNDKKYRNIDLFVYPLANSDGDFMGYAVVLDVNSVAKKLDSSDRKNAFMRYVVDAMLEGATVIDEKGKLEYANRKFYDLLGYRPDEILGQHWTFWCHEDDLASDGDRKILKNEVKSEGVHQYKVRMRRKDGSYIPVLLLVSKQMDEEESMKSIGLISDISRTLRLESEYREISALNQKILETISTGIITLDRDLNIKSINNQVEMVFKKNIQDVMGVNLQRAFPDLMIFCEWSGWVLRSKKPYQVDRYKLKLSSEGSDLFVNVRINPLFDYNKNISGVVCAFDDVTSSAKLEEKIEASYRKLETTHNQLTKLLERQKDFLADVSHELRTPLTVITGNVEVAMQDKYVKYDELVEVLKLVESEAKRMSLMVEDLMTLAKMEGGEIGLNYAKFYSTDLLEGIDEKVAAIARSGQRVVVQPVKEFLIRGDKERLIALLWNLVENAIKYSGDDGVVDVSIGRRADDNNLLIEVADNGIGIPEDQLSDIFERFYRIDKTRNRASGGSGLGLSICKWVAKAHGGEISVESQIGRGSVFKVTLPIVVKD